MSSCPAVGFLADNAVNPTGVNHRAAVTLMRDAQIQPETQANRNSDCSSSNFNPHEAIGKANSQSPLWWEEEARKDALLWGEFTYSAQRFFINFLVIFFLFLFLLGRAVPWKIAKWRILYLPTDASVAPASVYIEHLFIHSVGHKPRVVFHNAV